MPRFARNLYADWTDVAKLPKPDHLSYGNARTKDIIVTKFSAFLSDETGAVTVDWVVLTAAIVGLGLVVFSFIQPAISQLAEDIGSEISKAGSKMKASGTTP
jgi:Flp pilus assembly pilin Flp